MRILRQTVATLNQTVTTLSSQMATLVGMLGPLQPGGLAGPPSNHQGVPSLVPALEGLEGATPPGAVPQAPSSPASSIDLDFEEASPPPRIHAYDVLKNSADSAKSGQNKREPVSDVLFQMFEQGKLVQLGQRPLRSIRHRDHLGEKGSVQSFGLAMDLCQALMTSEMVKMTRTPPSQIQRTGADVKSKLQELDVWVVRANAAMEGKPAKSGRKPYWTGVGANIKKPGQNKGHLVADKSALVCSKMPSWDDDTVVITDETNEMRNWVRMAEEQIKNELAIATGAEAGSESVTKKRKMF
jgi:hypothetical protein